MHHPTSRSHDGSDCAVIFIHGFMGSPNQFANLADAVYDMGCASKSVLLPGHGGDIKAFARFGARDWQQHLQDEIDTMKGYRNIFLVGHSMGGLLALNASLMRENHIAGVVLLQTPLKVYLLNPRTLWLKLRLLRFPKQHVIKSAYIKSKSIPIPRLFFYPLFIKPVTEFYKLMRQTKKRLSEVFVPVCMFYSRADETTSYKSADLFYQGLCNTQRSLFSLDNSWHAYYDDDEGRFIQDKILAFIQQNRTS